ncbi:MAG: hypothetical protein IJK54_02900, partial [Clostridia bacterium]|nr:hypothetical protein [Clostridia bacterium]
ATRIPITIPKTYNPVIMSPLCSSKNASTKNAYIGNFAVQLMNGVNNIVIRLSLSTNDVALITAHA